MNELVFVSQKTRKLFGPEKLRGYFRARNSFEKVFLKKKTESVLYSAANCSSELPHNNPNSKVNLEHSVVIINFFPASNCTHKIFFLFLRRLRFLGFYNVSISCHLNVKA